LSTPFKDFEIEVMKVLLARAFKSEEIDLLARECMDVEYEDTGVGYFLTVCHPTLPLARMVFSEPSVTGRAGELDCGFVVFIEDGELTFECHDWGSDPVPEGFRDQDVKVTVSRFAGSITGQNGAGLDAASHRIL
jgi:hypothetical protein